MRSGGGFGWPRCLSACGAVSDLRVFPCSKLRVGRNSRAVLADDMPGRQLGHKRRWGIAEIAA